MTYGDYPDLCNVRKILVIKLRHLGDVLLTGPVFSCLKQAMPKAQIDGYVYKDSMPMLEGHPAIDRLIGYDRAWKRLGWRQRILNEGRLMWSIRKERYDLVINLTEGDRGAIAAKMAGAPIRVGFDPKGGWQRKLYTHIVKHCPSLRHSVERNLDAVRRIGIFPDEASRELSFYIPDEALERMRPFSEKAVLIHPASRWRFKCWSVSKMRELVAFLLSKGKKVVLTSGPDEEEKKMVRAIGDGFDVRLVLGDVSLKEFGALIYWSHLLVCVDSVALHLASALKKKSVILFGPTSDVTWGPWRNPDARVVTRALSCRPCYQDGCGGSKYSDCLQGLPTEAVFQAVEALYSALKLY